MLRLGAISLRHPDITQHRILQSKQRISVAGKVKAALIVVCEVIGDARGFAVGIADEIYLPAAALIISRHHQYTTTIGQPSHSPRARGEGMQVTHRAGLS